MEKMMLFLALANVGLLMGILIVAGFIADAIRNIEKSIDRTENRPL